ncbi:MAG: hypothetical protein ACLRL6_03585 [Clostridium sp.]
MKHALIALKLAADVGVEQTKEMIARIGRASALENVPVVIRMPEQPPVL